MSSDFREALLDYVLKKSRPGNATSVINAIDEYGWTQVAVMNIGDTKGKILDAALQSRQPKTVLELGTFLGYSSLRMASQLPEDTLIVTIDVDPASIATARRIHEHAGVTNRIQIVLNPTYQSIPYLSKKFHIDSFDFIFIDHDKADYLSDLKLLEDVGLIKPGTMIVADNIIFPGAPDYVNYIRNNPHYTSTFHESTLEYDNNVRDGVEVSIRQ
ncbi:unnamed protein product [Didymodactylos carnosus]|uniref:catechol O-methyltransferase n=1 Tax=Didymodactylos carnosus TaxID=1234261 RepID=A0A815WA89_9BILA|nr:unnamed protein product [Didymodactylos carnosus]CAF1541257.1 unnamed protein product [Didymodactylos carnosus]CAF4114596.1 unnamed protein product [Didymodactylos carnosus]CAF4401599.1 unnamed protein product [Didymodactylos carnosus]